MQAMGAASNVTSDRGGEGGRGRGYCKLGRKGRRLKKKGRDYCEGVREEGRGYYQGENIVSLGGVEGESVIREGIL